MEKLAKCKVLIGTYINDNIILGGPHVAEFETCDNKFFIKIEQCGYRKISIKALEETSVFELYGVFTKIESEQNRCAMACQGCGAAFYFF